MLTQPTIEKLYELRLGSMAAAFVEQQRDAKTSGLSFDERFAMLVDAEHLARDNRRVKALLKEAELRIGNACIEDVDASAQRGIDKGLLRQLATCAWIDQNQNTLITGATGTGKSYLACALGQTACRRGLRVVYRRMPRLLDGNRPGGPRCARAGDQLTGEPSAAQRSGSSSSIRLLGCSSMRRRTSAR